MNVSYKWLKDFIDLDLSPEETAEKLTLIGLEVDSMEAFGSRLDGVVVGEVLDVNRHPDADRLWLCRVNMGDEEVQVVCGADNVAKDQKVPVARVGTTLPVTTENGEPFTIRETEIRGEVSRGMICAEDELGISDDHSGIMVLDKTAKVGTPVNEVLNLYEDTIFDIEITPNRPDTTCHLGIARDLSAALDLPLKKPFETSFADAEPLEDVDIQIENEEKCHRYVGKIVTGVTIGDSPDWLQNRLRAIGVRPVNNVVDITNYVLFELGQPLHAFDLDTIRGNKIIVRDYDEEITFETLDHVKRTCSPGTLFICDGEGPVAIGGVIGGVDSEVSDQTRNILIESAYFDPVTIRKTAKEQNLQTDASYRFERGVDPNLQRIAAERCAQLIAEYAGGSVADACSDVHPVVTEPHELTLRMSYVNRLLGTELGTDETAEILDGLEFELVSKDKDTITYRIPTFRPDLDREVDLIEEVGRLYDYNRIPTPTHTKFNPPEGINEHEKLLAKIKENAKALRFKEISTNSLMPEKDAEQFGELNKMIHTLNPISRDMTTLRPSLLYGFLQAASYNFNRKQKQVRFFEVGNVFQHSENGTYYEGIDEEIHLLFGISGFKTIEHWNTEPELYDIFDLKAPVTAFLDQFDLLDHIKIRVEDEKLVYEINDMAIGQLYTVDPSILETYEIDFPAFVAEFSVSRLEHIRRELPVADYEPVSKYPTFEFDLAVIVDKKVYAGDMMKQVRKTAGERLDDIQVFDVFEGESLGDKKKSIAFRLSFLDKNKTLTINDIEPIINKILKALEKQFSAKLRS